MVKYVTILVTVEATGLCRRITYNVPATASGVLLEPATASSYAQVTSPWSLASHVTRGWRWSTRAAVVATPAVGAVGLLVSGTVLPSNAVVVLSTYDFEAASVVAEGVVGMVGSVLNVFAPAITSAPVL